MKFQFSKQEKIDLYIVALLHNLTSWVQKTPVFTKGLSHSQMPAGLRVANRMSGINNKAARDICRARWANKMWFVDTTKLNRLQRRLPRLAPRESDYLICECLFVWAICIMLQREHRCRRMVQGTDLSEPSSIRRQVINLTRASDRTRRAERNHRGDCDFGVEIRVCTTSIRKMRRGLSCEAAADYAERVISHPRPATVAFSLGASIHL